MDSVTRMFRISFSTEQLPRAVNQVFLSDKLDDLGIPRPKIAFSVDEYTLKGLEQGRETAVAVLKLIPKIEIEDDAVAGSHAVAWNTAAHPMGTTSRPSRIVQDRRGADRRSVHF